MVPTESQPVEYVIRDDSGNEAVHVPGDAERNANIQRAAQLLAEIRMKRQLEKRMLRAAIRLESRAVAKNKNRKREKLAKQSRKRNRR